MEYGKACELLGYSTNNSVDRNRALACSCLKNLDRESPLKFKVACNVLIRGEKVK